MKINDLPSSTKHRIRDTASMIRNSISVIDPFYIAKQFNIDVSYIRMDEPYAFKQYNPVSEKYSIYISNTVDRYSQKILCAHELGHIFCEEPQAVSLFDHQIDPVSEYIANAFASLIVPFGSRFELTVDSTIEEFNEYVSSLIFKKNNFFSSTKSEFPN